MPIIFEKVLNKIKDCERFAKIIEVQEAVYNIQRLNLKFSQIQKMIANYSALSQAYKELNIPRNSQNNWEIPQKKLFVWFIISFTYFHPEFSLLTDQTIWTQLSSIFFGKAPNFLQFQYRNMIKENIRSKWTDQEDQLLIQCVKYDHTHLGWYQISKRLFYTSNKKFFRKAKYCRQRWMNHLNNSIIRAKWTLDEDLAILNYVKQNGKRWSKLVPLLSQSRTQHMIKNRYNSIISKFKGEKKLKQSQKVFALCQALQSKQKNDVSPNKCQKGDLEMKILSHNTNSNDDSKNKITPIEQINENPLPSLNMDYQYQIPHPTSNLGYQYPLQPFYNYYYPGLFQNYTPQLISYPEYQLNQGQNCNQIYQWPHFQIFQ